MRAPDALHQNQNNEPPAEAKREAWIAANEGVV